MSDREQMAERAQHDHLERERLLHRLERENRQLRAERDQLTGTVARLTAQTTPAREAVAA